MAKENREIFPRVNFYDGQKITESDLDAEQIHLRSLVSNISKDFHGSGIVRDRLFESKILLDTSNPGLYSPAGEENTSSFTINSGNFDGQAIYLDRQPTDTIYGNRIEIESIGMELSGKIKTKVLVLGTTYTSLSTSGELVFEIIEFDENTTKLTDYYYNNIIAIYFNNFSGGTGKTYYQASVDSENLAGTSGKIILRESEPLKVFGRTKSSYQVESPNFGAASFISSSTTKSIEDEIKLALGSTYNFNDLYFELDPKEQVVLEKNAPATRAFGQKFLSKSDNIQKIDLLLSVQQDLTRPVGSQYDFSGDLVLSIYKLSTDIKCITDAQPENLIDFDPEINPLVEVSYSQQDLELLGYKLGADPTIVSFNFAETLIADPNIEPSIVKDEYYAFMLTRRGTNSVGAILIEKGWYKPSRKSDNGQDLNVVEQFGIQESRFVEFDSTNLVYVDDYDSSLWYAVHADAVEVTDGLAYTDDGFQVNLPKTEDYIGDTKISYYLRDIQLKNVAQDSINYVVLQRQDNFSGPSTHPRTGNFVYTRIQDFPSIFVLNPTELASLDQENPPILLARVKDKNVREAQDITGLFDKPGLIERNEIIILNPTTELLTSNLINRIITPDTGCNCGSKYRIIDATCEYLKLGDFDNNKIINDQDILSLVNLVGNTINAETTERKILGGEIGIIDFIKADLNNDGTIDGSDIEIIEDAVDGYVNFSTNENFQVLRIKLENILEENNYPTILTTTTSNGSTASSTNEITFAVTDDRLGLAIRIGDIISVESGFPDSGTYTISSKSIDTTGLIITVGVTDSLGNSQVFSGSSGFDVVVTSETRVNIFADNLRVLNVPFESLDWSISYIGAAHESRFIDACDLRRFVETNFIEESTPSCLCQDPTCSNQEVCSPQYKNQKVLSNDLYIPNGEIYSEPGVPYHGDFEYVNITLPIPPGSISGCQIDLYNTFIKGDSGTCYTAAGYPALKFSDGTYVGCEDSGGQTDMTKGRVKIYQAISSLYVDGLVDGYAVDGYANETSTSSTNEAIAESFVDHTYEVFDAWTIDAPTPSYASVTAASGLNEPANFQMETIDATYRYARLEYPSIADITGDFVIDFVASRTVWESSLLTTGSVSYFSEIIIDNGTTLSTLKVGWRQSANSNLELFFSGEIAQVPSGTIISDFNFSTPAVDDLTDSILFRIRRTNEAVFAMYYDQTYLSESNPDGRYVRIGGLPELQPGSGDAKINFELQQTDNPNAGVSFATRLYELTIRSAYSSEEVLTGSTVLVGRNSSTLEVDRAFLTFPLNLTSKTNIISARLQFTAATSLSNSDTFNIIPMQSSNADNLSAIIDYPLEQNESFIFSFTPGTVPSGETFDVDITSIALYYLSKSGHLPGFYKGLVVEPNATTNSSIQIERSVSFIVEYEEITTGVIFKIGSSIDAATGILTLDTKNILYDSLNLANRTVLKFGVYLKKSGFRNQDLTIGIKDLARIGIGSCVATESLTQDSLCFFITGSTKTGTFVEGPFPCFFQL
jgi:hypothetical protein